MLSMIYDIFTGVFKKLHSVDRFRKPDSSVILSMEGINGEKNLSIQKYADKYGRGLKNS